MDRRSFLGLASTTTLAGLVTPALAAEAGAPPASPLSSAANPPAPPQPLLLNVTEHAIEVLLAVDSLGSGWIEYGTTEALGHRSDALHFGLRPLGDRCLRFKLTGLSAGQRYFYRASFQPIDFARSARNAGPIWSSQLLTFRTLNSSASKATFTVWNDTHENNPTVTALAKSLSENPTDFLFWNGDVTNDFHHEDTLHRHYLRSPATPAASLTPFFFGRGNHDVRGRYARDLPEIISGPTGHYRYAFRHGPVAFLVMDTGEDKPDNHPAYGGLVDFVSYREEQRLWLEKAVQQPWFQSSPFRVALLHIPLVWDKEILARWPSVWGPGIRGWICEDGYAKWSATFDRAKINVVISGHTHHPAFFPGNAEHRYAQLIGGGPTPELATIISGEATQEKLLLTTRNLAGETLFENRFTPGGLVS